MRDKDPPHVFHADPRVAESSAQRLFCLGRVQTGVDEAPAVRSLDQIGVDDGKTTDGKGNGYAPDAGRDKIAQRAMGPQTVTLGTMEVSGPFV